MSIFDIINKKIAVNCKTEQEARQLIELAITNKMAENGWESGDTRFYDNAGDTCYRFATSPETGRLITKYGSVSFYKGLEYTIINAEDIDELSCDEICESNRRISVLF